jgi:hypothetical protein
MPSQCLCTRCIQLIRMYGNVAAADWVAPRLRRRSWAGELNDVEYVWMRAHPPRWVSQLSEARRGLWQAAQTPSEALKVLEDLP